MRRMLSTKSGATFNLEAPNMTFAVRKDVIESRSRMPRSMLHYAIEKFPPEERSAILKAV